MISQNRSDRIYHRENERITVHVLPADIPADRARELFESYRVHFALAPPPMRDYAHAVLVELIELDCARREREEAAVES